jgi:hypothetical protein
MLRDHLGSVAREAAGLRQFLEPALPRATDWSAAEDSLAAGSSLAELLLSDFRTAQDARADAHFLFAGPVEGGAPAGSPETVSRRLIGLLRNLEQAAARSDAQITTEFAAGRQATGAEPRRRN